MAGGIGCGLIALLTPCNAMPRSGMGHVWVGDYDVVAGFAT